jgi:hypothetical protein
MKARTFETKTLKGNDLKLIIRKEGECSMGFGVYKTFVWMNGVKYNAINNLPSSTLFKGEISPRFVMKFEKDGNPFFAEFSEKFFEEIQTALEEDDPSWVKNLPTRCDF